MSTRTVNKMPLQVQSLDPRLAWWMKRNLEPAARRRSQVEVVFPTADAEVRVRHRLAVRPQGFVVINQNASGSIYTSKDPDKFYSYLKCSVPGVSATVEIL